MARSQDFLNLRKVLQIILIQKSTGVSAENVLAVNSAAQGMFLIAKYVLNPGDEAIILDPVDFLLKSR
jgi:DNA-binding transcriptional MocR family regulator